MTPRLVVLHIKSSSSKFPGPDTIGLVQEGCLEQRFDYDHNPTWRIFRIMAEFVDGFNFIAEFERTVTFFGSARLSPDSHAYQQATELSKRLAALGFAVVTGGGPGIMEAANKGAQEGDGPSIGLNIELPLEQRANRYVGRGIGFHHFFTRKVMMSFSAEAYVFFPGGFGTLDEFFELITLLQTKKIEEHIPIVLVGTHYWQGLLEWMDSVVLKQYKAIDARDLRIWKLTDSIDEAVEIIKPTRPRKKF